MQINQQLHFITSTSMHNPFETNEHNFAPHETNLSYGIRTKLTRHLPPQLILPLKQYKDLK